MIFGVIAMLSLIVVVIFYMMFNPGFVNIWSISLIVALLVFSLIFLDAARVGYAVRRASEDGFTRRGEMTDLEEDVLEQEILEIIQNLKEINMTLLVDTLGNKYTRAQIKWVLDNLLISGEIIESEMGRFRSPED
jgi:hypothetical protein